MGKRGAVLALAAIATVAVVSLATGSYWPRVLGNVLGRRHIVYTQGDYPNSQHIFLVATRPIWGSLLPPVPIGPSPGGEIPCGVTSDERIVFTRAGAGGGDIFAVNADGTGETVVMATPLDEICQHVTPAGFVLYSVMTSFYYRDLHWTTVSGGTYQALTAGALQDEYYLATAPDGRIVFAGGNPFDGRYSLYSVGTLGTYPVELASAGAAVLVAAPLFQAVTRDSRVVYSRGGALASIRTDGTGGASLTASLPGPSNGDRFCGEAEDGRLIFTRRYTSVVNGQTEERGTVYAVRSDGSGPTALQPSSPHHDDTCSGLADADHAVFERNTGSRIDLYSLALDGSGSETQLRSGQTGSLRFERAAGGRVVFSRGDAAGARELWSIWPDASDPLRIVSAPPSASVAGLLGDSVLYYTYAGGIAREIWRVDPDGGAPEPVATSPEAKTLAFVF
jgi:hypothetical protein